MGGGPLPAGPLRVLRWHPCYIFVRSCVASARVPRRAGAGRDARSRRGAWGAWVSLASPMGFHWHRPGLAL